MPRLFSGIEIPAAVARRLTLVRAGLNGARWIDPENYHVTLRFLGDVDGTTARDFATAWEISPPRPSSSGSICLAVLAAGSPGRSSPASPRATRSKSLQRAHERAARAAGLPPEPRNYTPHVTVARLRGTSSESVATYLERQGGFSSEPFEVTRFVLFSSRASVGGGPYVVEAAYPLAV